MATAQDTSLTLRTPLQHKDILPDIPLLHLVIHHHHLGHIKNSPAVHHLHLGLTEKKSSSPHRDKDLPVFSGNIGTKLLYQDRSQSPETRVRSSSLERGSVKGLNLDGLGPAATNA